MSTDTFAYTSSAEASVAAKLGFVIRDLPLHKQPGMGAQRTWVGNENGKPVALRCFPDSKDNLALFQLAVAAERAS